MCLATAFSISIFGFLFNILSITAKFSVCSAFPDIGAGLRFRSAPGVIAATPLASFSLGNFA